MAVWTASVVALSASSAVRAGTHEDVTWLPAGQIHIAPGIKEYKIKLPPARLRPARQALYLTGFVPPRDPDAPQDQTFTLKWSAGGNPLPDWSLSVNWSGYVINLDTIESNPGYPHGELWIETELDAQVPAELSILGCPDVLAFSTTWDGPYDEFLTAVPAGEMRDYFSALQRHLLGHPKNAAPMYQRLKDAQDPRIGRFARRGLRMIEFQTSPTREPADWKTSRAQLMYLQQIGFFAYARGAGNQMGPNK
ncbi:MAG: hypothetical protein V3T70_05600, partial [Phycisphaerae bacterium]